LIRTVEHLQLNLAASDGKFANGAVTGAFSRLFNDLSATSNQNSLGITDEQRQMAASGDIQGFWESRQAMGDPVAGIALDSLRPSGGLIDYLFGGTSINNRLQAFARVYGGGDLNIDQVRVELMRAHVIAVDADTRGIIGLLNPRQIAAYHHSVFAGHGLPATTFGGTPFTGALWEASATRSIWCGGCDR
jgi:hypothetical protein